VLTLPCLGCNNACHPLLLLPQLDKLSGKCVYFVRTNPKGITEKTCEADMAVGEITGTALDTFKALVSDLYLPLFQEQQSWGKMPQDHTKEFLSGAGKFSSVLAEASNCLQGGIELRMPEDKYQQQYDLRPGSFTAAAADMDAAKNMEDCLNDWCRQVEGLLAQQNGINPGEEPGPDTELEFWRTRMAQFNSLTEQLKTKGCKLVLGVTHMGKTMVRGVARVFACSCCLLLLHTACEFVLACIGWLYQNHCFAVQCPREQQDTVCLQATADAIAIHQILLTPGACLPARCLPGCMYRPTSAGRPWS
jgi:hypothetical protein